MNILWLKTELLHPVDKGGKIRTYHMLKELKREHHITYLTLDDGAGGCEARERAYEYCHELVRIPHRTRSKFSAGFYCELVQNLVSSVPYCMKKYKSSAMRDAIRVHTKQGTFDVLVCDFLIPRSAAEKSVFRRTRQFCPTIFASKIARVPCTGIVLR